VFGSTPSWSWLEATRADQKIDAQGGVLIRHGGKHDWYQNPVTKVCQPVPRRN